jgi:hypothetical protein
VAARVLATRKKKVSSSPRWVPVRLIVWQIDLDAVVVQGIDNAALRRGPGHDPAIMDRPAALSQVAPANINMSMGGSGTSGDNMSNNR